MGNRALKEDTEYNLKESIKFLEKARELDPTNDEIIRNLAYSHTLLGQYFTSITKEMNNKK